MGMMYLINVARIKKRKGASDQGRKSGKGRGKKTIIKALTEGNPAERLKK